MSINELTTDPFKDSKDLTEQGICTKICREIQL
jgi:hypothetical protein